MTVIYMSLWTIVSYTEEEEEVIIDALKHLYFTCAHSACICNGSALEKDLLFEEW